MTITMYELAGADPDRVFSPFCWRIRLALAHKGLEYECLPWRYHDKDKIAFANWERVPVLVDNGTPVVDSWEIAKYLESQYPDRPSLFNGPRGLAGAAFIKSWTERAVHAHIIRAVLTDIFRHVHLADKAYFRESREKRFGQTLEEVAANPGENIEELNLGLAPMGDALRETEFLGGAAPDFSDYIVFAAFQWARAISEKKLLEPGQPVHAWRERMLDLFDGLARKAPGYPV